MRLFCLFSFLFCTLALSGFSGENTPSATHIPLSVARPLALPHISTVDPFFITTSSAVSGGIITNDGGSPVTSQGVCYSTSPHPTINDKLAEEFINGPDFISIIKELAPGITYYVRAFATNASGTAYGEEKSFATLYPGLPLLSTSTAYDITSTSASLSGIVNNAQNSEFLLRGICYSTSPNPNTSDQVKSAEPGNASFSCTLTGLQPGFVYYARSFAVTEQGTAYGNQIIFGTFSGTLPVLVTAPISNIRTNGASSGGNITSSGGSAVTQRGICFSTQPNPTLSDQVLLSTTMGPGSYTSTLVTGLPDTRYYIRAFATNSFGTAYGNELSFTTYSEGAFPTVITKPVTAIRTTHAYSGVIIVDQGSIIPMYLPGICWAKHPNPTIENDSLYFSYELSSSGDFGLYAMPNLDSNTTYYVRAFADGPFGTAYGNEVTFRTLLTDPVAPTVSTIAASDISINSATAGGRIENDHGYPVIVRALCYDTLPMPDISFRGKRVMAGSGGGSFPVSLTGLRPNTNYYIRAYASNEGGPAYGEQFSFTTFPELPLVTTDEVTYINTRGGLLHGTAGGELISERGFCYGLAPQPTIASDTLRAGSGEGSFEKALGGLITDTVYYIRAYAINSSGVVYGGQVSFRTADVHMPTVSTLEITDITTGGATCSATVSEDGGAAVSVRGICYSRSPEPTLNNSVVLVGNGTGDFSTRITGIYNTTYYVRAFATNVNGTAYGNELSFTTLAKGLATLTTIPVTILSGWNAQSGGIITDDGGSNISAKGICYATHPNPTIENGRTNVPSTNILTGSFLATALSLDSRYTYYLRAFATNASGTAYGNELSFTTFNPLNLPTLTGGTVNSVTTTGATSYSTVYEGGSPVTERGFFYGTDPNPENGGTRVSVGSTGAGQFSLAISGLSPGKKYFVRAYAINADGMGYSEQAQFMTLAGYNFPIVSTNTVSNVGTGMASSGGDVTAGGGSPVLEKGLCYSTNAAPTVDQKKVPAGSGIGAFTADITGLEPGTKYYVRAYATNANGTGYGTERNFTTVNAIFPPTITTIVVSFITDTSAGSGGTVTSTGGAAVIARGICYNTSGYPDTSDFVISAPLSGSSFSSTLTGLNTGTRYYVRAFATNSAGIGYGNELNFTTTAPGLLTVSTSLYSNLTPTSVRLSGSANNNGGPPIIERGICYGLTPYPDTSGSKYTAPAGGNGSFSGPITNLISDTVYYFRAYAKTENTILYANEYRYLRTPVLVIPPTVLTKEASAVTQTFAASGGNIISDGQGSITARGLCFATTPSPTIANTVINVNGTTGSSFNANLVNLLPDTRYYVRAFATNSAGTGYGNEISFITPLRGGAPCPESGTVTDASGNAYNTVQIGTQCWMKENLNTSKFSDGSVIPRIIQNNEWSVREAPSYSSINSYYGKLYNQYTISDQRNVCPDGWHVPTSAEWKVLFDSLGGTSVAGGKLKSTASTDNTVCECGKWHNPNNFATNSSGFTALPGSGRSYTGSSLGEEGKRAMFWTSDPPHTDGGVRYYYITNEYGGVYTNVMNRKYGYSIRCVRD